MRIINPSAWLSATTLLFLAGCSSTEDAGPSSAESATDSAAQGDDEDSDGTTDGDRLVAGDGDGDETGNGDGDETGDGDGDGTGGSDSAGSGGAGTGGELNAGSGGGENVPVGPEVNCPGVSDLPQCMADMKEAGGGTIVLGAKTYLLTDTLRLENDVNIVGQGPETIIAFDDSVKDTIDAPLLFSSSVDDIELEDFAIRCSIDQDPSSEDLRNEQIGLYLYCGGDPSLGEETGCNNISISRLEVSECSHGVHLKGVTGVTAIDLDLHNNGNTEVDFFHNVYFRRVGDLVVKQTSPTSGGYYDSPRGHGIRGSHLINVYFEGLSVYNNADHGVHVDYVTDMRMHNMDIRGNCANSSGACAAVKCYSDGPCELNADAPKEP